MLVLAGRVVDASHPKNRPRRGIRPQWPRELEGDEQLRLSRGSGGDAFELELVEQQQRLGRSD